MPIRNRSILAVAGIVLIPSPRFMENLATNIAYVAMSAMFMIVGWLWLKLIETKEREEQNVKDTRNRVSLFSIHLKGGEQNGCVSE